MMAEGPGMVSAYYIALRLLQLLESVQLHHSYKLLVVDMELLLDFRNKVRFWMKLLESVGPKDLTPGIKTLAQRFDHCACNWSDIIDYHVVERKRGVFGVEFDKAIHAFCQDIDPAVQELGMLMDELTSIRGEGISLMSINEYVVHLSHMKTQEISVVGIENPLRRIKNALTYGIKDRQVIGIVGVSGSGKTALARSVYEDPVIREHFDICYWVTVSQKHDVRKILQNIIGDKDTHKIGDLGDKLHHQIVNRRYLIVFDGLWGTETWYEIVDHFPNNKEGSRIIVTTKESRVAEFLSPAFAHEMDLLDEEASWDLLRKKVFTGEEDCPDELRETGRDTARKCKGLPMLIVTIGGLLSRSEMTLHFWTNVAKDISLVGLQDGVA